jgi:hypothetical protein
MHQCDGAAATHGRAYALLPTRIQPVALCTRPLPGSATCSPAADVLRAPPVRAVIRSRPRSDGWCDWLCRRQPLTCTRSRRGRQQPWQRLCCLVVRLTWSCRHRLLFSSMMRSTIARYACARRSRGDSLCILFAFIWCCPTSVLGVHPVPVAGSWDTWRARGYPVCHTDGASLPAT